MKVAVIKFADGTYYKGYKRGFSKTLLGAKLYRTREIAEMVQTSINFPKYHSNPIKIVDVELKEVEE
jgi:hypothetical protein